jgi:putative membrane protein
MEMFAWETLGKRIFNGIIPDELFKPTKALAANQGLYNGFLAAGLIWSLCITDDQWSKNIALFFLSCIIIAGIYGAITAKRTIFFTQALPAMITLALVLFIKTV